MKAKNEKRESRAVIAPLQGGGMVMFSCTADGADVAEGYITDARAKRQVVDIADIIEAVRKSSTPPPSSPQPRRGR